MIVGIDLGTTHSLIGRFTDEGPRLFPNALGSFLTPSVVSVDGDAMLVGQAARDRLVSHPYLTVGTDVDDPLRRAHRAPPASSTARRAAAALERWTSAPASDSTRT